MDNDLFLVRSTVDDGVLDLAVGEPVVLQKHLYFTKNQLALNHFWYPKFARTT